MQLEIKPIYGTRAEYDLPKNIEIIRIAIDVFSRAFKSLPFRPIDKQQPIKILMMITVSATCDLC